MKVRIKMPDLGTASEKIKVVRWLIVPGGQITRGQALLEVETDKTNMEVESYVSGRLTEVLAKEGEEITAGDEIAVVEVAREPSVPTNAGSRNAAGPLDAKQISGASCEKDTTLPGKGSGQGKGLFAKNRERGAGDAKKGPPRDKK